MKLNQILIDEFLAFLYELFGDEYTNMFQDARGNYSLGCIYFQSGIFLSIDGVSFKENFAYDPV